MSPKARRQLPEALYHSLPPLPSPMSAAAPAPAPALRAPALSSAVGAAAASRGGQVAITAAGGTVGTWRHRLLKEGSEGFSGALGRLVGHCSTCATHGGWESAQKAQDVTDAANDLGVDATKFQNRKETAMALVAAGWTYFDYYIHKREAAAGNQGCGGKLDLYGVSC